MCYLPRLGTWLQSSLTLLNIRISRCHEKSSSIRYNLVLTALAGLALAGQSAAQTPPATQIPPPAVPPKSLVVGEWNAVGDLEIIGKVRKLHGHPAEMESARMLIRADEIEYNSETGDVKAEGRVYFKDFDKNEQLWCSRLEYNTEDEKGKFWDVRGETIPRIVVRRGVLPSTSPFHFEGQWAERVGEKYILYNGWITNCKLPNPWWLLRGPKFDIVPDDRAIAHRSTFVLRKMPLFYTPYFYRPLGKNTRKSGFLVPNLVPHSQRGFMVGVGYYWAINRDYDVTYRLQDFTSQALTHHVDFRGKPRPGTDYDFILYGVQDRGTPSSGGPPPTYSGLNIYAVGRSDLGGGWTARGNVNYISSFRFRQQWSESYNEVIGSEIHSVASLERNWSSYFFSAVVSRQQNFESTEIQVTQPNGSTSFETNAVTIRKLPEAQFTGSDRQLWSKIPLWFSFDSAAGLLYRAEPVFDNNNQLVYQFQTHQFTNRVQLAPHLTSVLHLGDFHLVPSIGFQETFYGESQVQMQGINHLAGTNLVRSARDFSLDLIFPSLARVYQKKSILGDKVKHVIEPRATYRYVTGVGEDFNRFIRFDERDLLSNTNELELSLANRLFAKRGDTVQEIFTWELAQKRYFDPTFGGALVSGQRNVFQATADLTAYAFLVGPRSSSPVASLLRVSPIGGFGVQWQADYDPLYHAIVDSSLGVDYRWTRYHVFAGNNEVRGAFYSATNPALSNYGSVPPANQFRVRIDYGDANRRGVNAGFEAVYDYRKSVIQYSTAQVTYNTDCCGISVQYRRYNVGIRDESQFRIAFSIANVGSFGTLRKQDRMF
jgi:LPS-assembly protein